MRKAVDLTNCTIDFMLNEHLKMTRNTQNEYEKIRKIITTIPTLNRPTLKMRVFKM